MKTRVEGEDKRLAMLLDMANLAVELKATLTLIWGGWVRDFTPPPVGFPVITQKR